MTFDFCESDPISNQQTASLEYIFLFWKAIFKNIIFFVAFILIRPSLTLGKYDYVSLMGNSKQLTFQMISYSAEKIKDKLRTLRGF